MEVVRFSQAPHYSAPDHDDVIARRLQGGEASSAAFVLVGHSTFPPGGGVPMDGGAPIGKVYIVTEGAITFEQADGARHVLGRGDSIYVAPGEARAVLNDTADSAAMIVITPPVGK